MKNTNSKSSHKRNLAKKLNINYLSLTNKTYTSGNFDLLHIPSPKNVSIDYLASYSDIKDYKKTKNTAVCFFENDIAFDGMNGIWNAIMYDDTKALKKFKRRFEGVKYLIAPDYSIIGDEFECINMYNIQRSRIVSLWFIHECHLIVIPNIMFGDEKSLSYFLDGLEGCQTITFSTKGCMKEKSRYEIAAKAIAIMIEKLKYLKTIIVYSDCIDDANVLKLFEPAIQKGIKILIPDNRLKARNIIKKSSTM